MDESRVQPREHCPVAAVGADSFADRGLSSAALTIHRFCVTHKKPVLPDNWYDDCIALGDFQPDSALHVRQLDQFWHDARPLAYGAAGTYVLPIAMRRFCSSAQLIEISNYRKRVLPVSVGIECPLHQRALSLDNFDKLAELSAFIPGAENEFLVAQPLYVEDTILEQYATCHHRRDILDYTALAVEAGVLDSNSASAFLGAKYLVPGGAELGIYPKSWSIQTLSMIELVGRQFLHRYSHRLRRYDDYQIRAIGFLSERLGSFFLLRHLMERYANNIPAEIFGHMTIIAEEESSYFVGVTSDSE